MKITGQVLFAIGLTLFLGGVASYFWTDNVELDYRFGKIDSDQGRLVWTLVTSSGALVGFVLMRLTDRRSQKRHS